VTRSRPLVVTALALALLAVLTACASPRAALGTSRNSCYQALPLAADAVHHQGRFDGLTLTRVPDRFTTPTVRPSRPGTPAPASTTTTTVVAGSTSTTRPGRPVCLVAFKGTFDPQKIDLLRGPRRSGPYAIVVVSVRTRKVAAVYLAAALPRSFRHL